jgi:hypothetical protein
MILLCSITQMIVLINDYYNNLIKVNRKSFAASGILEALLEVLQEEKENEDLLYYSLRIMHRILVHPVNRNMDTDFITAIASTDMDSVFSMFGTCELLIPIIETYLSTGMYIFIYICIYIYIYICK